MPGIDGIRPIPGICAIPAAARDPGGPDDPAPATLHHSTTIQAPAISSSNATVGRHRGLRLGRRRATPVSLVSLVALEPGIRRRTG
jgi:hypothetical protein